MKDMNTRLVKGAAVALVAGMSFVGVSAMADEPVESSTVSKDHFEFDIFKPVRVDGVLSASTAEVYGYADGVAERLDYKVEVNAPVGSLLRISDDFRNPVDDYTLSMSSGLQLQGKEDGFYYWKVVSTENWVAGSVPGVSDDFAIDFELLPEPEYTMEDDVRVGHFFSAESVSALTVKVADLV